MVVAFGGVVVVRLLGGGGWGSVGGTIGLVFFWSHLCTHVFLSTEWVDYVEGPMKYQAFQPAPFWLCGWVVGWRWNGWWSGWCACEGWMGEWVVVWWRSVDGCGSGVVGSGWVAGGVNGEFVVGVVR